MKKYTLILFVFTLFVTLLGFNANSASADFTPGCTSDQQIYSLTTGQICNTVSLTQNLQISSRGNEVTILQRFLKEEGYFFGIVDGRYGRITARAVGDFQEDVGLSRTETVDVATLAKINAAIAMGDLSDTTNLPAGCTSTIGYSPTTGVKCDSLVGISFPPGCTSTSGFSVTTGQRCSVSAPVPIYPSGCSSYSGYSSTTGLRCDGTSLTTTPSNSNFTITTSSPLPNAKVGTYYQNIFRISGTSASLSTIGYTWRLVDGSLPSGLFLSASADIGPAITGTPTTVGTYNFTINVTNSSQTVIKQFTLTVNPATIISTINRAPEITSREGNNNVQLGQPVSFSFRATDAENDDLFWTVDWGDGTSTEECPSINTANGTGRNWSYNTSHTYTNIGYYVATVYVTDCRRDAVNSSQSFNIGVGLPTISTVISASCPEGASCPNVTVGEKIGIYGSGFNSNSSIYIDGNLVINPDNDRADYYLSFSLPASINIGIHTVQVSRGATGDPLVGLSNAVNINVVSP